MTLLFKRRFLTKILRGDKTQTRRRSRPSVKIGGTYHLRNGYSKLPERITVTALYTQRLGDITPGDAEAEGFGSVGEFKEAWTGIYGGWDPEQKAWVVEFTLTETFKEKP
ncbi:ASCH domain-containing protein [Candidatus Bathyarchaeota archaeon]|nr:ASCH domain-containing protein [Candidatus Bathyarchaeota archaeon]